MPSGAWRWAALGFVLLALMAAGLAVAAPEASRWLGVVLVAGIGVVALLFFYGVWPRERFGSLEARRVAEAVTAVGDRELVIAGGDCGFGTFTGREWVIEPVVWLKLRALREGSDIASSRLWS